MLEELLKMLKKSEETKEEAEPEIVETKQEEKPQEKMDTKQSEPIQETEKQEGITVDRERLAIDYQILTDRQLFLSKYGHIPNINKIMPVIESIAYRAFAQDLAKGNLRGTYINYLEEAKEQLGQIFEEASKTFKNFKSYSFDLKREEKQEKPRAMTVEDLYGEYIKNLKNITTKYNKIMHLGWKPRGVRSIEKGALSLADKSKFE